MISKVNVNLKLLLIVLLFLKIYIIYARSHILVVGKYQMRFHP